MGELILHHYDGSPYSEMVRLGLGIKHLSWRSVTVPNTLPKPDLMPLTGGYRQTPVLQIGADIYCDTSCILRRLEAHQPEPSLHPRGSTLLNPLAKPWGDRLFRLVIDSMFGTLGDVLPPAFIEDRSARRASGLDLAAMKANLPSKLGQLRAMLALVEEFLGDGRPFLNGPSAALSDLAIYHPLWLLRRLGPLAELLQAFPTLQPWFERMDGIGHGEAKPMEPKEALEIAKAATAAPIALSSATPGPWPVGERVTIRPEEFPGDAPVEGEVVASTLVELVIRRSDARVGEVVVHFPLEGYLLQPA